MSKQVKISMNFAGCDELRKSVEIENICKEQASNVLSRLNNIDGYVMERRQYTSRNGWVVKASKYPAIGDNLKNDSLLRAIGTK